MDGAKVLIDSAVLERVDATQPPYLSRTSWVNHLLDRALKTANPIESIRYPYAGDDGLA